MEGAAQCTTTIEAGRGRRFTPCQLDKQKQGKREIGKEGKRERGKGGEEGKEETRERGNQGTRDRGKGGQRGMLELHRRWLAS